MTSWDDTSLKMFIDLYRETEFLWNVRHLDYKNVSKRSLAMKKIADDMLSKGYGFSPEELKKKMHSLRTSYNKTNKKVKDSMKSGAGLDEVFKPKGFLYEELRFLGTTDQSLCETRSTLDVEPCTSFSALNDAAEELQPTNIVDDHIVHSNNGTMFDDTSLNPINSTPRIAKKKRKANDITASDNLLQAAINHLGKNEQPGQKHVHDSFGEMVGQELKQIDPEQVRFCKKVINDALFLASCNELGKDSQVVKVCAVDQTAFNFH